LRKRDREGGFLARRIVSLVLAVSLLLLVGCGGGGREASPRISSAQEKPATTVEKATGMPRQTGGYQGKTTADEDYCIEKQFAEATQGMSPQEAADYETGIINEAVQRGLDPRTVLAERGFVC
jgi:hypothetical protein